MRNVSKSVGALEWCYEIVPDSAFPYVMRAKEVQSSRCCWVSLRLQDVFSLFRLLERIDVKGLRLHNRNKINNNGCDTNRATTH